MGAGLKTLKVTLKHRIIAIMFSIAITSSLFYVCNFVVPSQIVNVEAEMIIEIGYLKRVVLPSIILSCLSMLYYLIRSKEKKALSCQKQDS